jgi:hypothetical protein
MYILRQALELFYCYNILSAFYNSNITVKKQHQLLWFLKVTWLSTPTEGDTGMLKHVGVAIS